MTVHVLHAGNGYTYLTRSVAACDARLGKSESLADYYVDTETCGAATGPPARRLSLTRPTTSSASGCISSRPGSSRSCGGYGHARSAVTPGRCCSAMVR